MGFERDRTYGHWQYNLPQQRQYQYAQYPDLRDHHNETPDTQPASQWEKTAQDAYKIGKRASDRSACDVLADLPSLTVSEFQFESRGLIPVVQERVDVDATQKYFDDLITRFDKEGKGYLSKQDMRDALKNQELCNHDVQVLTSLRDHLSTFAGLSDDEVFFENDGVYPADFKQLVHLFDVNGKWEDSKLFYKEHWGALTQDNHDGVITKENVQAIMGEARIDGKPLTPAEMESLKLLVDNWRAIANPSINDALDYGIDNYTNPTISGTDLYLFDPVAQILD